MEEEGRGKRGKRGRGGEREGGETADPHTQVFLSPKPDLITSSLIACCAISSHSLGNLCARYPFKKPFLHIQSESNFFFSHCVSEPARGRRSWERRAHPNMHTFMHVQGHLRPPLRSRPKDQIAFRSHVLPLFILSSFTPRLL